MNTCGCQGIRTTGQEKPKQLNPRFFSVQDDAPIQKFLPRIVMIHSAVVVFNFDSFINRLVIYLIKAVFDWPLVGHSDSESHGGRRVR